MLGHSLDTNTPVPVIRAPLNRHKHYSAGQYKQNEKEGETVTGTERVQDFYLCTEPGLPFLPSQYRQRQLLLTVILF